jgi:branched-chain amino acid transport system substrate-binding protein
MNKTIKWIIGIVVIALVIWGLVSWSGPSTPADDTAEPIKIGFIGPLTGDAANIGQNAQAAVSIAVDEINAAGGIGGRPLEVIYEDGKCNGRDAANAANKLVSIDNVPVIIGGACSGETLAFSNFAEQNQTTVLSYCSSAPSITDAGDYIFRNMPSDSFQGSFDAEYVYNVLGYDNVAVLFAKTDYTQGLTDVFVQRFQELGGVVSASESFEQTARDLRTQLLKIKAVEPQLIFFVSYPEATIPGLKQISELGIEAQIFGADTWNDPKIYTETGEASEGVMYSVPKAAPTEAFKAKLQDETGSDYVGECSASAYDAIHIISQVMSNTGTDSTDIKNALYETTYTGGVFNDTVSFDQNGDVLDAKYGVWEIQDGTPVEIDTSSQ